MSRTNTDVDDELVEAAMRKYHLRTKRDAVELALRRLVAPQLTASFLAGLRGIGWDGGLREMRAGGPAG